MAQTAPTAGPRQIDPRGPRFGAAITSVVLALTLVLGLPWGLIPLALQTAVFALGAVIGLSAQPYGALYRQVVRPRLGPPAELEDERPPRFAQSVGLVFAVVGLIGGLFSVASVFYVAVAAALVAALLNAVFNFCLGCEMYLLGRRAFGRARPA